LPTFCSVSPKLEQSMNFLEKKFPLPLFVKDAIGHYWSLPLQQNSTMPSILESA